MAYTDDSQMGPRRKALVDSLAGGNGFGGIADAAKTQLQQTPAFSDALRAQGGQGAFGGATDRLAHTFSPAGIRGGAVPPIGGGSMGATPVGSGDKIQALSMYNTTPEQNAEIQSRQNALIGQQNAAFKRDTDFITAHGGNTPAGWRSEGSQLPGGINPLDVLGPNAKNLAAPQQGGDAGAAAPASAFDAAQQVGHDGKTSAGLSRDQYRDQWQASGAKSVEDLQKFLAANGGTLKSGNGTVMTPFGEELDMMEGARTNGNGKPSWGGLDGGGGAPAARGGVPSGGSVASMLQGDPSAGIQAALQNLGGLNDNSRLQALIAQLSGGGQ